MIDKYYIVQFQKNTDLFKVLFDTDDQAFIHWKKDVNAWSLLEILCHLKDEEVEDFRHRLKFVLEGSVGMPPGIDPQAWVKERAYADQNFHQIKEEYFKERMNSIEWLTRLENPQLKQSYDHPTLGTLDGHHFLNNWLAHDYLHIRQITRLRYDYLNFISKVNLDYAGTWK